MSEILQSIVVSACLGALVGLIRQWSEQMRSADDKSLSGVRTYTLWAVLGCLAAYLGDRSTPFLLALTVVAVAGHLVYQHASGESGGSIGSTSFASILVTLFIGALVYWNQLQAAAITAAITMVILGVKQPVHAWTRKFTDQDLRATLQFVAITGVVLPLVPNRDMGPFGGFNPLSTWLMVVLISGIGFFGYVAIRLLGERGGLLITSLLGGLVSSTATSLAFSRSSREEPSVSRTAALAVVIASTVMIVRVPVMAGIISPPMVSVLWLPCLIMALPAIVYGYWHHRLERASAGTEVQTPHYANPLSLVTAIKFALAYSVIAFLVKAATQLGHTASLVPLSFISGLTDMDAITLSMAREHSGGELDLTLAARSLVAGMIGATVMKGGIAVVAGSPVLKRRVGILMMLTIAAGIAGYWIIGRR